MINNSKFLSLFLIGLVTFVIAGCNSKHATNPLNQSQITQNKIDNPPQKPIREKINKFEVPILMYHYIRNVDKKSDELGYNLSVSPENFEKHLKWLKDNGFDTVGMDYLTDPYKTSFKPVVITFDDGYRDAYNNAFPLLKKYGYFGIFYLITDSVNLPYYITWEMAKEMSESGMQFGSHTLSHPDLRNISDIDMDSQLRYSKEKIEKELGKTITDFCFPSGKYEERTISKLKEIGYKTSVTTKMGIANENSDLFKLPRRRITNNTDISLSVIPPQPE